jgi:hypothetical protein
MDLNIFIHSIGIPLLALQLLCYQSVVNVCINELSGNLLLQVLKMYDLASDEQVEISIILKLNFIPQ